MRKSQRLGVEDEVKVLDQLTVLSSFSFCQNGMSSGDAWLLYCIFLNDLLYKVNPLLV